MAQGVLAALTGGEKTTLVTAVTAIKTATDAVIALGYPAYPSYLATREKEILFNDKLNQINVNVAQLIAAVTDPEHFMREK